MDFKSARRLSSVNEEICRQSFFIKSPPLHLFLNQTSWKRRYFALFRSSKTRYELKYFKGQQVKGNIPINEISEVEIGIGDYEKMAAVKKMFKCQSTEVITIKTENRVFYLIGTDSKNVEDWATFLFTACMEKEANECQTQNQKDFRSRSKSSPPYLDQLGSAVIKEGSLHSCEYKVEDVSAEKKRPYSDPSPQEAPEENPIYELPRKLLPRLRCLPNNHCVWSAEQLGEKSTEDEKEEEYYASPRSLQVQLEHHLSTPIQLSDSDDKDTNSNGECYMIMKHLTVEEESSCARNELLTLPGRPENSSEFTEAEGSPQIIKTNVTSKEFQAEDKSKVSFLSVVQLSIILSKITDDSQLKEVDILLPKDDVINNLTLTEAVGHVCVSQWKDPLHLRCIFHHGDRIVAVNDLHVKSMDEISLFISRSTRKEVKLTIRRLPDSEIFHVKRCMCS